MSTFTEKLRIRAEHSYFLLSETCTISQAASSSLTIRCTVCFGRLICSTISLNCMGRPATASISSTRNDLMAAAFSVALISLFPPLSRAVGPLLFPLHYRFFVPKINKKHFLCSATNAKCQFSGLLTVEHTLYFQKYYKFDFISPGSNNGYHQQRQSGIHHAIGLTTGAAGPYCP